MKRLEHEIVSINGFDILVRDQQPLHEASIAFESGWNFARWIAHVNQHVFFWPGSHLGPIRPGLNHYRRYASESPAFLRIPTRSLTSMNQVPQPLFCRFNSGAPRYSGGRPSPRGSSTYLEARAFDRSDSDVIEVVFRGSIALPSDSEFSNHPGGPWRALDSFAADEPVGMSETFRGGCFCGAVRFELSEIFDAGYCRCSICRRFGGAPLVLWANAPAHAFRITAGTPTGFASSENWTRYFCPVCGAHVYGRHTTPPEDAPDRVCVCIPSLDRPDAVRPTAHIWCGSGMPDFDTRDDLPRFPDGRLSPPSQRRSWRAG